MNARRSFAILILFAFLLAACAAPTAATQPLANPTPTTPPPAAGIPPLQPTGGLAVYAEDTTWENWSWNAQVDRYSTKAMHFGTQALEVIYTQASAGLSLRSAAPIDPAEYRYLSFWVFSPDGERHILVFTQAADDNAESAKTAFTVTDSWQEVKIPLAELGGGAPIKRISIQDDADGREGQAYPLGPIYIDDLQLLP
jgi:hypothetical protein